MKRELRNQFRKTKKHMKESSYVKDGLREMLILMEMVVEELENKTMKNGDTNHKR